MNIAEIISSERILLDVDATCAKQAFRAVADSVSRGSSLDSRHVLDALCERERLGSTGVGDGVSIPHARFKELKNAQGLFLRLNKPIDMDAMDDQPVNLMFVLLAPEDADNEHLKILSRIARILRSPENKQTLSHSASKDDVLKILVSEDQ